MAHQDKNEDKNQKKHEESHTNLDELQLARSDAAELARGTVLAGRYEIEAALGRGGAGLVLRAQDRELREAVAIKVLRPDLGGASRWIERLAREVKLARQLRHPNVCRVFDFEKADGHVFIVMELAKGGTLRRELDEGSVVSRPLEARLDDARAVAAGLAAIHAAGIAHRDVTPQNVLRMDDGRLVVSDFGLATEVSQTTTSIHGGTLAYMAPEVVRGQRATFASDVWALGVVIHEIVFGERPHWSKPVGGAMVAPGGGRTMTRGERVAFSVCRACTAETPAQRPRSAREVEQWLENKRVVRAPARTWRARVLAALAVVATVAAGRILLRPSVSEKPVTASVADAPIPITGQPADWMQSSKVLAAVDGRIRCLVTLPDRRTLRFVWGSPARAEDLDPETGRRTSSRLVPASYAEGCPDVSPDGKRLLYEGYAPDGRAFAFVSDSADGRDGRPVVPAADPSVSSEPRWLADGDAFALDVDSQHMGVFSMTSNRLTVLPEPTRERYMTSFRFTAGQRVFVGALLDQTDETEFVGTEWPSLEQRDRFRLPGYVIDLVPGDRGAYFASYRFSGRATTAVRIVPSTREARAIGRVPNRLIRYLNLLGNDLAYTSIEFRKDLWVKDPAGALVPLTHDGKTFDAVPCGRDVLVTKLSDDDISLWLISQDGVVRSKVAAADHQFSSACSPDGKTLYYSTWGARSGVYKCDLRGNCQVFASGHLGQLSVSPDGARIAMVSLLQGGPRVQWLSTAGGEVHDVTSTEGLCRNGWSTNGTLWVARRNGNDHIWAEFDLATGKETGKRVESKGQCDELHADPPLPVPSNLSIVQEIRSEIRLQRNVAAAL